jgi:hypothetical protein
MCHDTPIKQRAADFCDSGKLEIQHETAFIARKWTFIPIRLEQHRIDCLQITAGVK